MNLNADLKLRSLTLFDLAEVLRLQDEVLSSNSDCALWLRFNDASVFQEILENPLHTVLGYFSQSTLVAFGVLFNSGLGSENIARYFTSSETELLSSRNLKVIMTSPTLQRSGLSRSIIQELRNVAVAESANLISCTIHSLNNKSKALFQSMGYEQVLLAETPYGEREIWRLNLTSS